MKTATDMKHTEILRAKFNKAMLTRGVSSVYLMERNGEYAVATVLPAGYSETIIERHGSDAFAAYAGYVRQCKWCASKFGG